MNSSLYEWTVSHMILDPESKGNCIASYNVTGSVKTGKYLHNYTCLKLVVIAYDEHVL